jgi:hypothetical protein
VSPISDKWAGVECLPVAGRCALGRSAEARFGLNYLIQWMIDEKHGSSQFQLDWSDIRPAVSFACIHDIFITDN